MAEDVEHGRPAVATSTRRPFDVFLSHHGVDKSAVELIAEKLKRSGVEPWLDAWELAGGADWQEGLAAGLAASRSCAVFVGASELGSWEQEEVRVALDRGAKDPGFRVFLVLLPDLPEQFDTTRLSPFLRTRTWVDFRKGLHDERALHELVAAVRGLPVGPRTRPSKDGDLCPYRGLAVFEEEHADYFFGRDAEVQRLLEALKGTAFLGVIGASGSGKSSLVRAGLIPALRGGRLAGSERWTFKIVKPGAHPLDTLSAALVELTDGRRAIQSTLARLGSDARTMRLATVQALGADASGRRVVWVIDQFEEVFTLCDDATERRMYIENLLHAAAPDQPSMVIVTLRADFYHRCLVYPDLAQLLAAHQFAVSPMSPHALRDAIERPARQVGLTFEDGLVETILDDIEKQPGALPLLEHALLELWNEREGDWLTLRGYQASGRVEGAIAQRADEVYGTLSQEQREVARRVLLRLTQPGQGTQDTRRRARMGELSLSPERSDSEDVVAKLVQARLLTTGGAGERDSQTVEVAHEALIRSWPRLQRWVDEDREGLLIHHRLSEAAEEWRRQPDESALYRGTRLGQALEWRARPGSEEAMNDVEREFLDVSKAEADAAKLRARRRTRLLGALSAGLAVVAVLAIIAVFRANSEQRRAEDATQRATSGALAAQALVDAGGALDRAALLSLEASRHGEELPARRSILRILEASTDLNRFLSPPAGARVAGPGQLDVRGDVFAVARGRSVEVRELPTGRLVSRLGGHRRPVVDLAFTDRGRIVTSVDTRGVVVRSAAEGGPPRDTARIAYDRDFPMFRTSPDGRTVASGTPGDAIALSRAASGRKLREATGSTPYPLHVGAFDARGDLLAAANTGSELSLIEVATGEHVRPTWIAHDERIQSACFSPNGRILATGADDKTVVLWDVPSGRRLGVLSGHDGPVRAVAFDRSGETLASGSEDGTVLLWDVADRRRKGEALQGHGTPVVALGFAAGGDTLVTAGDDGTVGLWDVALHEEFGRPVGRARGGSESVSGLAFSGDGDTLALGSWDGDVLLYEQGGEEAPRRLRAPDFFGPLAFGLDDRRLAGGEFTEVSLWNLDEDPPAKTSIRPASANERTGQAGYPDLFGLDLSANANDLAFAPRDEILVSGWSNGTLYVVDAKDGSRIREVRTGMPGVDSLAFAADGETLATGSINARHVRFWDTDSWDAAGERLTAKRAIDELAFSPDGRTFATTAAFGITLWDLETREKLKHLRGHTSTVENMVFSRDGKLLTSTGYDGLLNVWDVQSGERLLGPIRIGQTANETSLAVRPDGEAIAWGGARGIAFTWEPFPGEGLTPSIKQRLCQVAGRNLTAGEWGQFLPEEDYRRTCPR